MLRRLLPESARARLRGLLRATPAGGMFIQASDEFALIEAELAHLDSVPWTENLRPSATAGMTERVIEIPWVMSRYRGERRVLDIGTAWALPVYSKHLATLGVPDLQGLDLVAKRVPGFQMSQGDVRALPYATGTFDLVLCVSTLEHIGLDVSGYAGHPQEQEATGDVAALREMARTLVPQGRILITVPFGRREQLHWLRQYDQPAWEDLVRKSGLSVAEAGYYSYGDVRGWRRVQPPDYPNRGFQEKGAPNATGVLCADLRLSSPK